MSVQTPNMNLIQPAIGTDTGLTWEQSQNSNMGTVDLHNHTSGNGVQIPPGGLNINASLPFNNQQATNLQATVFQQQASLATLNALFVGTDGNLYYNDGVGDPSIKMTSGGAVNATSSGIVSGTATAAFSSGVLVVNSASNTPANIQAGSILLGNNVASSKYLTLSPPASMASNYTLTLPSLPSVTSLLSVTSGGTIGTSAPGTPSANSIITISSAGVIGSAIVGNARAIGTSVVAGGVAGAISSTNFNTTSTTPVLVTNQSVTITTTGRPVFLTLVDDGSLNNAIYSYGGTTANPAIGNFCYYRGSTQITGYQLSGGNSTTGLEVPASSLTFIDFPSAGTYTYSLYIFSQSSGGGSGNVGVGFSRIIAYEI